jgi:acyl-CoA thioester hydrolase
MSLAADPAFGPAPVIRRARVEPEWIDYNGHMNVAYYLLAFDQAYDDFMDRIGLDAAYRERTGGSVFAVESHLTYGQELLPDSPLAITLQLLALDPKKLHVFMRMFHAEEGYQAATGEFLSLHVDLNTRRTAPMGPEPMARVEAMWDSHKALERPPEAGKGIALKRPG